MDSLATTKKTVNPSIIKGWRSFCCPIFGSVGHGNIHVIYQITIKLNWYFVDCSYQFRCGFSQVDLGGDSLLRMTNNEPDCLNRYFC